MVRYNTKLSSLDMAKCPNCGKEVAKPDKSLENHWFHIEAYKCKSCDCCFKVTEQTFFTA